MIDIDNVSYAREHLHKAIGELESAQHRLINAGVEFELGVPKRLIRLVKTAQNLSNDLLWIEQHFNEPGK